MNNLTPSLKIRLENVKLVSVNQMYSISRCSKGFKKSSIRRSKEFTQFDDILSELLDDLLDEEDVKIFKDYLNADDQRAICMTFNVFVPKRNFFSSDASNYPKPLEDIIKFKLNIDDSRNTKSIVEKFLSSDTKWHTEILLEIYELPYKIPSGKWADHILGKLPNNREMVDNVVVKLNEQEVRKRQYRTKKKHPVFSVDSITDSKDPSSEVNRISSGSKSKKSKRSKS